MASECVDPEPRNAPVGVPVLTDPSSRRRQSDGLSAKLSRQPRSRQITVPVLVMHGDDDQIVPYADSGPLSAKLVQNGTLKTYKGFPHGMPTTQADTINADLLAFVQSGPNGRREGAVEAVAART